MADTMQFHPDVREAAEQLQELRVHAPTAFAALKATIGDQHRLMAKGVGKSVSLKLGLEPNTVAALGGRDAVAAVALHAAETERHADRLARLTKDELAVLRAFYPDPADQVAFLAHRAGATP